MAVFSRSKQRKAPISRTARGRKQGRQNTNTPYKNDSTGKGEVSITKRKSRNTEFISHNVSSPILDESSYEWKKHLA